MKSYNHCNDDGFGFWNGFRNDFRNSACLSAGNKIEFRLRQRFRYRAESRRRYSAVCKSGYTETYSVRHGQRNEERSAVRFDELLSELCGTLSASEVSVCRMRDPLTSLTLRDRGNEQGGSAPVSSQ